MFGVISLGEIWIQRRIFYLIFNISFDAFIKERDFKLTLKAWNLLQIPYFYGIQEFFTYQKTMPLDYPEPVELSPQSCTLFLKESFWYFSPMYILVSHVDSFVDTSWTMEH